MTGRVLVTTSSFGVADAAPLERLQSAGFEVVTNPHGRKLTVDESKALMPGIVGLVAGTEQLTAEVMDVAPTLRVISRVGVGMDSVDAEAARARDIAVFNTPDAHVDAVAEYCVAALFNGFRRAVESDRAMHHDGRWHRPMGRGLRGKRVGIVGLGRVGRAICRMLSGLDVQLAATDPHWPAQQAAALGVAELSLNALLAQSDAVVISTPGLGQPVIDAAAIQQLRDDVVVVNAARGGLIDEAALEQFLRRNDQAFAVLDVFAKEPYEGGLTELPNCMLTAHLGGYTREARVAMEMQAAENCLRGLGADA